MLRIGLAGVGGLGKTHLLNYLQHPGADVVALADIDEDRRSGNLADVGFNIEREGQSSFSPQRSYSDYRELCRDSELDVVSIALPTDLHCDATILALESGKHVFCEKPIALTSEDGHRMVDAAKSSGKTLMIGHCLRFWPEYIEVEKIIRSQEHGKALAASFSRFCSLPFWGTPDNWFAQTERSGGPVIDLHVHETDLCNWWWGKPDAISATGAHLGEIPTTLHSRWKYNNGPAIQFDTGWEPGTNGLFYFNFKITFERATLLLDSRNDAGLQLVTTEGARKIEVESADPYAAQDRYFLDCLAHEKPADRCPPADSVAALECAVEEARQMAQSL